MRIHRTETLDGTLRGTRAGFAFFRPDEGGEDIFVHAEALAGALHGDRVRVRVTRGDLHDYRPSAEVEEILGRGGGEGGFTGNLERIGKGWFVRPDSPLLPERLRVRLGTVAGVSGAKVRFRVETRPGAEQAPVAVAADLLGEGDDARHDLVSIAGEASLDLRFPEAAEEEALASAAGPDPEAHRREDFRGDFVLTIDPPDAKDFDDAVAILPLPGGGWRLWVHIADVTSFVAEGGPLDREASRRGTSVYFPGAVIPMLPEGLSSVAASLGPGVDRRVLSVRIDFDGHGTGSGVHVSRGWIRSTARLHYAQAQAILDGKEDPEASSPEIVAALCEMARLAGILRERRFAEGGFEFNVAEAEMTLGPDGVPRELRRRESLESHRLIEEFMIAANRAIGTWALQREVPFLFRVHAEPDAESLARFLGDALALVPGASHVVPPVGVVPPWGGVLSPGAAVFDFPRLRRWLEALPDSPLGRTVQRLFLRALRKANYAPIDIGHFGLGLRGYCHFTSPIRRYPDLFVHRRVKELIDGRLPTVSGEETDREARCSSRAEVNAQEAEREMVRLKTARFMERRLGAEFAGHVTGMIPAGLFVELDTMPVEGFVPRESLPPGFRLADDRPAFLHDRSREEFRPGDPVRVAVARVDLRARRVEFGLVRVAGPRGRGRRDRAERGEDRHAWDGHTGDGSTGNGRTRDGIGRGAGKQPGTRKRPRSGSAPARGRAGRSRSSRAKDGRLRSSGRPPRGSGSGSRTRTTAGPRRGGPGKRGTKRR
jgi:ribonuclease R